MRKLRGYVFDDEWYPVPVFIELKPGEKEWSLISEPIEVPECAVREYEIAISVFKKAVKKFEKQAGIVKCASS